MYFIKIADEWVNLAKAVMIRESKNHSGGAILRMYFGSVEDPAVIWVEGKEDVEALKQHLSHVTIRLNPKGDDNV